MLMLLGDRSACSIPFSFWLMGLKTPPNALEIDRITPPLLPIPATINSSTMMDAQQATTTEVRVEMPQPYYSQEDVHQILEVAIAHQAEQAGQMELTREQLLEIADDLGINATDLEVAERTWLLQRGEQRERQAFDRFRRQRFQQRLVRYLVINGGLAAIAWLSTGSLLGVPLIMLFWGMFLALDAWNTFFQRGDRYEIAFQRWCRRRRLQRSFFGLVDHFFSR